MSDPQEKCGIFGIYGDPDAARVTFLGLSALQHRGQESAGIVVQNGQEFLFKGGMGLVSDVFSEENVLAFRGSMAIGHVRYSTTGASDLSNCQPLRKKMPWGEWVAIAHNGNFLNYAALKSSLEKTGSRFETSTDTEVILHLLAQSPTGHFSEQVAHVLPKLYGAYSMLLLSPRGCVAIRDPKGFRPLVLGRRNSAWVFASESCALDLVGARVERELKPGEMIVVDPSGIRSFFPMDSVTPAQCAFELIYLARPDSLIFGRNVYLFRKMLGQALAKEHPVEADLVIPVPDSSIPAALGYSQCSGIPCEFGLIRNSYVGRTFIAPNQSSRQFGVRLKLNPVKEVVAGKRLVVVDDSVVRGTTGQQVVTMLRNAGAKSVHLRITSPPIRYPCYYGVDILDRHELIAADQSVAETCTFLNADSLAYLNLDTLRKILKEDDKDFCFACFTGRYPELKASFVKSFP